MEKKKKKKKKMKRKKKNKKPHLALLLPSTSWLAQRKCYGFNEEWISRSIMTMMRVGLVVD